MITALTKGGYNTMFYKKIFKFGDILQANLNKDNLAGFLTDHDRNTIAARVIERAEKDQDTMKKWMDRAKKGIDLIDLNYAPKHKMNSPTSYNIQYPVLLNGANSTSARLFTSIHRDKYIANPSITGSDPDSTKNTRKQNVKQYINAVTINYPHSNWMRDQRKMYPELVVLGTKIKQIQFDAHRNVFDSGFIPYTDIFIHNKAKSMEDAPAITKCVYMSHNDVMVRVNKGIFLKSKTNGYKSDGDRTNIGGEPTNKTSSVQYADGTEGMWECTYALYEQHMWADLDGDGYAEPYIAFVDKNASELLRLTPRIAEDESELRVINDDEVVAVQLIAERFFADYHYKPDPCGNFWSMGLAHEIGPLNQAANEGLNILMNTAILSNQSTGFVAGSMRGATGRFQAEMGTYKTVPGVSAQALRDSVVEFATKEPSPVLKELVLFFITTAEKIASLNEALSGEMPNRELPVGTMLLLIEQSLKNAQDVYMSIHAGLTKELQIMARLLEQYGSNDHYRRTIGVMEADIKVDFDLTNLDFTLASDSSMSSDAETLIKMQVFLDMIREPIQNGNINSKQLYTILANKMNMPEVNTLIQDAPEPAPNPMIALTENDQLLHAVEIDQKHHRELAKHNLAEIQTTADISMKRAQAIGTLVKANAEAKSIEADFHKAAQDAAKLEETTPDPDFQLSPEAQTALMMELAKGAPQQQPGGPVPPQAGV